jgi:hypothetical protein
MSTDNVIQNAMAAAETPASGPPAADPTEGRRNAIMAEADYWADGPKTKSLRDEMRRLVNGEQPAARPSNEQQEVPAGIEARLKLLNDPKNTFGIHASDPKVQAAAMVELRKLVAAQDTPEQAKAFDEAPLAQQREMYGLEPPTLAKPLLLDYEENFAGWESDLLVAAKADGLDARTVRELRDLGIELGMKVDGAPLPEEVLDDALARFGKRLNERQRAGLKSYWRRIEGGAT